jgi:phenylacetate-CoA ligase
MLLMGFETPFTIDARAFLANHRAERRSLFAENGLPDIFQYHPLMRYIELNADREFLFTANLGIPLIRYNMRDKGYLFSYDDFAAALPPSLYKRAWKLPIVALEGRSDYTVIFYAANIYPTHIRIALNHATFLNKITGKFAIEKKYTKNKDVSLMIHVELQPKIMTSYKLCSTLQKFIEVTLLELNSEYRASSYIVKHDIAPHVILHAYQSAPYFTPGIKPRYIV